MPVSGGWKLSDSQVEAWIARDDGVEYMEWIEFGLFDPDTNILSEPPEWMNDGDPTNGPFDFFITQSQGGAHW